MIASLSSNIPRTVLVGHQQAFNVCAVTSGDPDLPSRVVVTLEKPSQKDDFDLYINVGGEFIPIVFNDIGIFIFEEPVLNSCILSFITFNKAGKYLFNLDLVSDEGNIPLANLPIQVKAV
ncbi:hypothetical protein [Falsibacillus albus]|uniref:Exosporium protein C n=1 Tax=Falsibacillus albus TaxID=2478915 RepID=A0A3L7JXD3_9BACI|nr:hypothetical protein [Falsibacillus albus]RLQ94321.1 hypothetical protein D9X91_14795 [Falsibacillus albus]